MFPRLSGRDGPRLTNSTRQAPRSKGGGEDIAARKANWNKAVEVVGDSVVLAWSHAEAVCRIAVVARLFCTVSSSLPIALSMSRAKAGSPRPEAYCRARALIS